MIFCVEMPADNVHSHFPPHFHSLKHTILPPLTLALVGLGVPVAAAVCLVDDTLSVGRPLSGVAELPPPDDVLLLVDEVAGHRAADQQQRHNHDGSHAAPAHTAATSVVISSAPIVA